MSSDKGFVKDIQYIKSLTGRNMSLSTVYIDKSTPRKKISDEIRSAHGRLKSVKTPSTKQFQSQNLVQMEKIVKKMMVRDSPGQSFIIFVGTVFSKDHPNGEFFEKIVNHDLDIGETKIRTGDTFYLEPLKDALTRIELEIEECDEEFCNGKMQEILRRRKEGETLEEIGLDSIQYSLENGVKLEYIIVSDDLKNKLECPNDDCLHINHISAGSPPRTSCIRCGAELSKASSLYSKCVELAQDHDVEMHVLRSTSSFYKTLNEDFFGALGERMY